MDIELSLGIESIDEACPTEPLCVEPHRSLRHVLRLLKQSNGSGVMICRDEQLIGIFTERDALRAMAGNLDLEAPIENLMTPNPVTVRRKTSITTAIRKMVAGGLRRLPVVDSSGRPTAVINVSGIVHFLVEHFPRTIYNLPPAPHERIHQREGA